jgi:tetratricopeptide (TPR) repeat protein
MHTNTAAVFAQAVRSHVSGQLSLAEQLYRSVIAVDPQHVEAIHGLGVIAQQCGRQADAIALFRRAALTPEARAAHWNNLGVALTAAGDFRAAIDAYAHALQMQPGYAEAFNNQGVARLSLGEPECACSCFQQAVRQRPNYPEAYNNLGQALQALGEGDQAHTAFEQALRLKPDYADALIGLGVVNHERGELDRAVACYRQARQLQPTSADASNNLATALKEQGRLDEALAEYRAALQSNPDHALVHYNLSQFAAEGLYSFPPEAVARIHTILAEGRCTAVERSVFGFVLAGLLDREGRHDDAFSTYRDANDLRLQLLQSCNQAFDPAQHRTSIDHIIANFDEAYFQRVRGWGVDTELPIFIVGMPRSGTTLVEQILSSHPEVFGAGELGELPRRLRQLRKEAGQAEADFCACKLDAAAAAALGAGYLQHLSKLGGGAVRVTTKTLDKYLHLGLIAALFPRARVVYCRRDPLDVCVSCYVQNFKDLNYTWSLEDIGAYHREYERLMEHWRKVLPLQIHEVKYEELVERPEKVVRALLAYCGLNWDDRCLRFFANRRVVRTASTLQVRKPLTRASIGRWKRYRAHLGPLFRALGMSTTSTTATDPACEGSRETQAAPSGIATAP